MEKSRPRMQIIRGLPGSGKTTLALKRYSHLLRLETDMFFYSQGAYRFSKCRNERAVRWFLDEIEMLCMNKVDFVATGVFAAHTERLAETIARVLDGEAEQQSKAPAETAEPAPEKKETDALSLEELEQDLFGAAAASTTEAEATKKIDKFYTLYRKNEEFQRLLDEEYSKLKAAGGPAPEPAIPEPEEPVPAKKIEDATIYQDFDLEKEAAKLREEQAKAAAEASGEAESAKSGAVSAAVPAAAAAAATGAAILTADKPEEEIVEVEKGGGFLTVLAVIIAILLIVLLGIILVLNFMPDSALAFKIDSVIENITSTRTTAKPIAE